MSGLAACIVPDFGSSAIPSFTSYLINIWFHLGWRMGCFSILFLVAGYIVLSLGVFFFFFFLYRLAGISFSPALSFLSPFFLFSANVLRRLMGPSYWMRAFSGRVWHGGTSLGAGRLSKFFCFYMALSESFLLFLITSLSVVSF